MPDNADFLAVVEDFFFHPTSAVKRLELEEATMN